MHASKAVSRNGSPSVILVRPLINIERNSPFFLPIGLLCMAGVLRDAGYQVEIVDYEYLYRIEDFQVTSEYLADFCEPLIAKKPRVIGITVLADTVPLGLLMGKYIKANAPDVTVVLGGPGIFGSFPQLLDRYPGCADYVCQGEGELALLDLVESLSRGEHSPAVRGMFARFDDQVINFGKRQFACLDDLPTPAYDMLPVQDYLRISSPRIFDVYIGSGCTYACKFCVTSLFWDRDFRSKSPDVVMRELDFLYENYGVTQFNFLHDNLPFGQIWS